MPEESEKKNGWRKMLSVLGKPKNLARTVISVVPGGGVVLEAASQIDSENTELALAELQLADEQLGERLSSLASSAGGSGWADSASEMMARTVDLAVLYDESFHPGGKTGKELYQSVAHGCAVGDGLILCTKQAFDLAKDVAQVKRGRLCIIAGGGWYDFSVTSYDEDSALYTLTLGERDAEKWEEWKQIFKRHSDNALHRLDPPPQKVRFTLSPFLGEEIGFLHSSEAEGYMLERITRVQLDLSYISHFERLNRQGPIKRFVTGVLPGRVLFPGSPIFAKRGTLCGFLADCTSCKSDAGRRAVIGSLFPHPLFVERYKTEQRVPTLKT